MESELHEAGMWSNEIADCQTDSGLIEDYMKDEQADMQADRQSDWQMHRVVHIFRCC